jgi:hypothetical protein
MPLALGMLYVVQQLLSKIFVPETAWLAPVIPLGTTVDGGSRHRPGGRTAVGPVFQAGIRPSGRKVDAVGHGDDTTG